MPVAIAMLALLAGAGLAEPCSIRVNLGTSVRAVKANTSEQVGDVIRRLGIEIGPLDRVYPRRWGEVFEGLEILVVRVRAVDTSETIPVPYEVRLVDDPSLPFGKVTLTSDHWCAGVVQRLVRTYYRSDGIDERVVIQEFAQVSPMPKVFTIGSRGRPDALPERLRGDVVLSATAYSPEEPGLSSTTSLGVPAGRGVVAVDPSVIPYGTRMWVEGYGWAVAADCGGDIEGNRIDLCYDTVQEAVTFGQRNVRARLLP